MEKHIHINIGTLVDKIEVKNQATGINDNISTEVFNVIQKAILGAMAFDEERNRFKIKIEITPECEVPDQIYCEAVELFENHIQKYLQERANLNDQKVYDDLFPNGSQPETLEIYHQFAPLILNLPVLRVGKTHPIGGNAHRFCCHHDSPSQHKMKHESKIEINRLKV